MGRMQKFIMTIFLLQVEDWHLFFSKLFLPAIMISLSFFIFTNNNNTLYNIKKMQQKNLLSPTTLIKLLIVILLHLTPSTQKKAILISSSLGYYNIRQINNILKLYHHLRDNGLQDSDIILIIAEIQACCQKNHKYGTLSFYDGDYTNLFRDVEVDYYQSEITAQAFAEIVMGYYGRETLNKRKIRLSRDEELFVYVTGHGGDTYFKIRERQALIDQQFASIFRVLHIKQITKKIAVMSDSCSAITPFQTITIPNFIALGSSSFGQKSLSHGYDSALNQPKTDDFSFYFDQILSQKASIKDKKQPSTGTSTQNSGNINTGSAIESWTFGDVHKYMDMTKLKVNSKLIVNKGLTKNEKLSNFVKDKQPELIYKKISGQLDVQKFFRS